MSPPGQAVAKTVGQIDQPPVDQLQTDIRSVIARARQQASTAVNAAQNYMYWHTGQRIHTELTGHERAPYGAQIVATVSRQFSWTHFLASLPLSKPYLNVLPPPDVLYRKLHEAIETAWARIEAKEGDAGQEGRA